MSAKYASWQKVKIILVKDQDLQPKYEGWEFQRYLFETGRVVHSDLVGIGNLPPSTPKLDFNDIYLYIIRLDKDRSIVKAVPEDALEAIE